MILSGKEIERRMQAGAIVIRPFASLQLNPNSYNLRLHNELLVYDDQTLDMHSASATTRLTIPPQGLVMQPGRLYLGRTVEYTETHGLAPMLEGRSSIGRLGLMVHATAGFGDIGFRGYWTLEMFCVQPLRIYADVKICQICYHSIEGDYHNYEGGKYQSNSDIQPSLLYRELNSAAPTTASGD